jgi:hypothetical protein
MSAPREGVSKKVVIATNCRQLVREESSRGESSKGKSSTRGPLIESRREGEPRRRAPDFFSVCRELPYEGPSEVSLEMQPMTLCPADDEKPRSKGKKKVVDKGKAVYRDPWVFCHLDSGEEEKIQEAEPSKFVTISLGISFKKLSWNLFLRLTHDEQSKTKERLRTFRPTCQN